MVGDGTAGRNAEHEQEELGRWIFGRTNHNVRGCLPACSVLMRVRSESSMASQSPLVARIQHSVKARLDARMVLAGLLATAGIIGTHFVTAYGTARVLSCVVLILVM